MKWIIFFVLITHASFAQAILQGKVVDAAGEPLAAANVFVANTTYQTITNDRGLFYLQVPASDYNVIVSFVGFESVAVPSTSFTNLQTLYTFKLNPATAVLKTVTIIRDADRAQYLKMFTDHFLGRTRNAQSTKILNIEDLYLDFNAETGVLEVSSDVALQIENPALNYHITFVLSYFSYNTKTQTSIFAGYPVFRDLQSLDGKRKRTERKERQRAYLGSNMHFIRSVFTDSIARNGFKIKKFTRTPNPEYRGDEDYHRVMAEARKNNNYELARALPPKFIVKFINRDFSATDLILERDGNKYLQFSDYFDIIYEGERPEHHSHTPHQQSQLQLAAQPIQIFADGSYAQPDQVLFFGYMGWEKLADMMPFDYENEVD